MKNFTLNHFLALANIVESFVDRAYGPNYDPQNVNDSKIINMIHKLDESLLIEHNLSPTHMLASMSSNKLTFKEKFYPGTIEDWD